MSLHFIYETFTNNFNVTVLDLLSAIAISCAILVIIAKNPVKSVLFLIGLFLVISAYLCLIDLTFIGLAYLLVYVGAVSILFLFILMLINIRISELLSETRNSIPLVVFVSSIMAIVLGSALNFVSLFKYFNVKTLSAAIWDCVMNNCHHITSIGNILYTNNGMWLIETSIILLLAMVGAIVITLKPQTVKDRSTNFVYTPLKNDLVLATIIAATAIMSPL